MLEKEITELRRRSKTWRTGKGMAQEQVSTLLELAPGTYAKFERGESNMNRNNRARLLATISGEKDKCASGQKVERLREITCPACFKLTVYSLRGENAKFCLHCGKPLV